MTEVIGGVGVSHIPAIGRAVDAGLDSDPQWRAVFEQYEPARDWVSAEKPDVAIVIYNDHGNGITLDMLPTFALGVADHYAIADEGRGPRPIPGIPGDADLAWHLAERVIADDFDLTVCQALKVDHGLTIPMSILWGTPDRWPVRVIPIAVNVIQQPTPSPSRCLALGQAIRRAIDSYDSDQKVVVVGTGGMSHQLQGARAGHIDSTFDTMFLDQISAEPERLAALSTTEYMRRAGSEGAELVMWLVMRGALSGAVQERYRSYHVPVSNSAAGLIVLSEADG